MPLLVQCPPGAVERSAQRNPAGVALASSTISYGPRRSGGTRDWIASAPYPLGDLQPLGVADTIAPKAACLSLTSQVIDGAISPCKYVVAPIDSCRRDDILLLRVRRHLCHPRLAQRHRQPVPRRHPGTHAYMVTLILAEIGGWLVLVVGFLDKQIFWDSPGRLSPMRLSAPPRASWRSTVLAGPRPLPMIYAWPRF
jgi:hypothetical protein